MRKLRSKNYRFLNVVKKAVYKKKIDHKNALVRYRNFNKLTNNEKDMFLIGFIAATTRSDMTTKGNKRQKLASEYSFESIKICSLAFLIIHGIGTKNYTENGINPRKHKLEGCISNYAISFESVLEILTFIKNYANFHGLPSPGMDFYLKIIY